MNLQTKNNQKGFTIVELLIVIVVIGILAAITIVAFNGIQNRGKTASGQSAANTIIKKAEAANSVATGYPNTASGTGTGSFGANAESSLAGSGIVLAAISAAPTNPATVEYFVCATPANAAARVSYWNYTTGAKVQQDIGAACTTWSTTAVTGVF